MLNQHVPASPLLHPSPTRIAQAQFLQKCFLLKQRSWGPSESCLGLCNMEGAVESCGAKSGLVRLLDMPPLDDYFGRALVLSDQYCCSWLQAQDSGGGWDTVPSHSSSAGLFCRTTGLATRDNHWTYPVKYAVTTDSPYLRGRNISKTFSSPNLLWWHDLASLSDWWLIGVKWKVVRYHSIYRVVLLNMATLLGGGGAGLWLYLSALARTGGHPVTSSG